jgi:hypothetical protein
LRELILDGNRIRIIPLTVVKLPLLQVLFLPRNFLLEPYQDEYVFTNLYVLGVIRREFNIDAYNEIYGETRRRNKIWGQQKGLRILAQANTNYKTRRNLIR